MLTNSVHRKPGQLLVAAIDLALFMIVRFLRLLRSASHCELTFDPVSSELV